MKKRKRGKGRPKVDSPRDVRFTIGLCQGDTEYLDVISERLGVTRGALIVFTLETIIAHEFSVVGFLRAGMRIQKKYREMGNKLDMPKLRDFKNRPTPRFPIKGEIGVTEFTEEIEKMKTEINQEQHRKEES
ncbi:MAG: hypothetical protein P1U89_24395 [Verrucomicrobiales bacterium]|nr:hypothetical protein [Verrucomicrobiales bacterium]